MHELAEQMLDLNRPRDPGAQRCRPLLVAREVSTLSLAGAGRENLQIDITGDEQLEAAIAPDALKQILLNVVQNGREAFEAWNARPSGSAYITVDVARVDDEVRVQVRDNGPGIPPAILSRIFDPFFTTKDAVHGVGLGLFVAEGLVRSAGGRITAGNVEGSAGSASGAWFRIELPVPPAAGASPSFKAHATAQRTH